MQGSGDQRTACAGPPSVLRMLMDLKGTVNRPPGTRFLAKKLCSDGLTFKAIEGLVCVKDVVEDGTFSESLSSRGDICLSIDGVTTRDAKKVISSSSSSSSVGWLLFDSFSVSPPSS